MIAEETGSMVTEITQGVFQSFLGLDVIPHETPETRASGGVTVTSMVHISGGGDALTLSYECSEAMARTIASTMFGSDAEACTDEEISDAIGEIANMVGGNLKSTLDADASLSLPSVVKGTGYQTIIPRTRLRCRLVFECGAEHMVLTLYSPTAAPTAPEVRS